MTVSDFLAPAANVSFPLNSMSFRFFVEFIAAPLTVGYVS
jgi:hypothetical protein